METIEQNESINDFESILKDYIVPLFDVEHKLESIKIPKANNGYVSYNSCDEGENYTYSFYPVQSNSDFHFDLQTNSSHTLKKPVEKILEELMSANKSLVRNDKSNETNKIYNKRILDTAFELGMCKWLASDEGSTILFSLLSRLKMWAGRTYEGKRVPFGIVIDFNQEVDASDTQDYLNFLDSKNSALFTDGVFSGVLLDKRGNLVSYITHDSCDDIVDKKVFVPYPHEGISKYCDKRVGLIALGNGEILLLKKHAVNFAWRDNKWVFFDWKRISERITPYFGLAKQLSKETVSDYVREAYCTLLDVSFSHSGGCFCIIAPCISDTTINSVIKERIDSDEYFKKINDVNQEKLNVVRRLIGDKQSFFEFKRPLRKEILAMDGATAVFPDGKLCCAGSIVLIEGTSTDGARLAAAKNLAKLGVGIKISEDGAIEAYGLDLSSGNPNSDQKTIKLFKIC